MSKGDANLREKIQAWLMVEGFSLSELTVPEAQWAIHASREPGPTLVVGLNRKPEDQLRIQATVGVDPQHKAALSALSSQERVAFLWDLRFSLLQLGVDFEGVTDQPEQIALVKHLYLDGLSKNAFMNAAALVRNGVLLTIWSFRRRFSSEPGPAESHAAVN